LAVCAAALLASAISGWRALHALRTGRTAAFVWLTLLGLGLMAASFAAQFLALGAISPTRDGYGATLHALNAWQGLHVLLVLVMGGYSLARRAAGRLDAQRRVTFENTLGMWLYTAAQGLATALLPLLP
jgi:cytochrome c oxidase subunit I+III